MKHVWVFLVAAALFGACSTSERTEEWSAWREENGHVKVLTTIAMIADLVKAVGDGHVDTMTLIRGDLDPHSYQLVKGDDEKFALAQVIFFNGLGLEHGPSLQQQLYHSPKAVGLGDKIREKAPERILSLKNQVDPHIWMDISLWSEGIPHIVEALGRQDPAHAEEYRSNGQKLMGELQEAHRNMREMLATIPVENRYLVSSHDAFNYFAKAYLATDQERLAGGWQDRFAAPEGLAPESQLSATDIQEIISHLAKFRIHVVFPESNVSKDSIRKIVHAAKEKGLQVHVADTYLYADAMGKKGSDGDTYVKMIQHNAATIHHHLSKDKNHDQP